MDDQRPSDSPVGSSLREPRRKRSVTIKDVAQLSKVSAATVTRALQGHPRVRDSTRARVEDAARQLGYRPDHAARALVTGRSRTFGLLVPTIRDPYWAEVAAGIEPAAAEAGFAVLIASGYGDPVRAQRTLEVLLGNRVDGIAVTTSAGVAEPRRSERWNWKGLVRHRSARCLMRPGVIGGTRPSRRSALTTLTPASSPPGT
jgi:transcriptional regulator with XRE-family HTH domain